MPTYNPTGAERHVGAQLMAVNGPLARTIGDLRLGLEAMAARDLRDPWWTPVPHRLDDYPRRAALTVAPEGLAVQPRVEAALRETARRLTDAGWQVEEVACPPFRQPARLQALLWLAEFRRSGATAIGQEGDADAAFVYAQMARLCPAPDLEGLMDAIQARNALLRQWNLFLDRYPVLICPVSAETPFPDLDDVSSPARFDAILEAQLTQVGLPFMGLPGLTVTTGIEAGVPCGAQLVAGRYREDILLDAGTEIEARGARIPVAEPARIA